MNEKLKFGQDVRFERLIFLPAIGDDDAEEIIDDFDDFRSALDYYSPASDTEDYDDPCDYRELRDYIDEVGVTAYAALVATPIPNVTSCGSIDYFWSCYTTFWVCASTMGELKDRALKVAYQKRKSLLQRIKND